MNKIYAVAIMALTLALVFAPLSASANISYHPDWNKSENKAIKAYGWQFSKVCGLDICAGEANDGSKSKSFIQNDQSSSQSISDQFGMSATGEVDKFERSSIKNSVFGGHFYIKGLF